MPNAEQRLWFSLAMVCGVGMAPLAAAAAQPLNDLGAPYVTTCLVSDADCEPVVPPIPTCSPPPASTTIQCAIEKACGRGSHNIQVVLGDTNSATVHLTAATEEEACQLWDKIQQLPELLPYRLEVNVRLRE
jgi:hypothetical protein